MAFGSEIKRLRNIHNVSAQVLADAIGIDSERLRSWEKQDLNPRSDDQMAIEKYFGMPLQQLVSMEMLPKVPTREEVETRKNEHNVMTADIVYPKLAQRFTRGNIRELEEKLGFANGAIGNAIKRKSIIKPAMQSLIIEKYPIINRLWLKTGEGDMVKDGKAPVIMQPELSCNTGNSNTISKDEYIATLKQHYEDMKATKDDLQQTKNELLMQQSRSIDAIATLSERNNLFEGALGAIRDILTELKTFKVNSDESLSVLRNVGAAVIENQHRILAQVDEVPYPEPAKKAAVATPKKA